MLKQVQKMKKFEKDENEKKFILLLKGKSKRIHTSKHVCVRCIIRKLVLLLSSYLIPHQSKPRIPSGSSFSAARVNIK